MKLNKQDLIKIVGTMQYQSDMLLSAQHMLFELEKNIFHYMWRTRYVIRRLKQIAKHYGEPDIAVSEEELDDQIKSKEN